MKNFNNKTDNNPEKGKGISRKDALKKGGKYAAFTAAGMLLLTRPAKAGPPSFGPVNTPEGNKPSTF